MKMVNERVDVISDVRMSTIARMKCTADAVFCGAPGRINLKKTALTISRVTGTRERIVVNR
jgi:hypothetical protein